MTLFEQYLSAAKNLLSTKINSIYFLIFIGLVVFFNGVFNNFLGDDLGQVLNNPLTSSLDNLINFFTNSTFYNGDTGSLIGLYFRPITITFFAVLKTIFGENIFVFHFFQILIHITNSVLLFLIFRKYFKNFIALFISIIFLVHPLNSEVVFYVSNYQEVLFFVFGLIAFLLLQSNLKIKKVITLSIFLFLSLLSKETGILFFLAISLFAYFFKKEAFKLIMSGQLISLVAYFSLRINAIGLFATPQSSPIASLSLAERLINLPAIFFFYIKTFFFPLNLSSSYQWVIRDINLSSFFLPLCLDMLFISVFVLFFYYLVKTKNKLLKLYLFFSIWFFSGMLLHLQIIPLDATVAERWFYFPMVGLLGIIAVPIFTFKNRINHKWGVIFFVFIVSLLCVRTFIRSFDWRNNFTLATHDIKISKQAYGLESMLSYSYFNKGEFNKAKLHAEKSIALHPYATNYINLGAAEFNLGNYKESKTAFLKALEFGEYYQAYQNLGFLTLVYGDPEKNINTLKNFYLKKRPNDSKLWLYLAILEYKFGNKSNSINAIKNAYTLNSGDLQIISVYNAILNNKPVEIDVN